MRSGIDLRNAYFVQIRIQNLFIEARLLICSCPYHHAFLKVCAVNPTCIIASNNGRDGERCANLGCEARTRATGTGACVANLLKGNILSVGCAAAPLAPACTVDDARQTAVLKADSCILAPRATEVNGIGGD